MPLPSSIWFNITFCSYFSLICELFLQLSEVWRLRSYAIYFTLHLRSGATLSVLTTWDLSLSFFDQIFQFYKIEVFNQDELPNEPPNSILHARHLSFHGHTDICFENGFFFPKPSKTQPMPRSGFPIWPKFKTSIMGFPSNPHLCKSKINLLF